MWAIPNCAIASKGMLTWHVGHYDLVDIGEAEITAMFGVGWTASEWLVQRLITGASAVSSKVGHGGDRPMRSGEVRCKPIANVG